MFRISFGCVVIAVLSSVAGAQAGSPDCVENAIGQTVCGADAAPIRARIAAEEAASLGEQDAYKQKRTKAHQMSGSVYDAFERNIGVRGGYFFSDISDITEVGSGFGAASMGKTIARNNRSTLRAEAEILVARDHEEATLLATTIEATSWTIATMFGLSWIYDSGSIVDPYLGVSVGAGNLFIDTNFTDADHTLALAYSGRAGLQTRVSKGISLDLGYRYLGLTRGGTEGLHSGELGLNYHF